MVNKDDIGWWSIVGVVGIILIGIICYSYEQKYIVDPLNDFCQQNNNSNYTEHKVQGCFDGSDYLLKCTNGEIYGLDRVSYCDEWDTWGKCTGHGKKQFKLSHLGFPRC